MEFGQGKHSRHKGEHPVCLPFLELICQYATAWSNGYPSTSALCRRPLPEVPQATKDHVESECRDIVALERQLEKEGYVGPILRKQAKVNGHKTNGHA